LETTTCDATGEPPRLHPRKSGRIDECISDGTVVKNEFGEGIAGHFSRPPSALSGVESNKIVHRIQSNCAQKHSFGGSIFGRVWRDATIVSDKKNKRRLASLGRPNAGGFRLEFDCVLATCGKLL
jgi:hypothetical protein